MKRTLAITLTVAMMGSLMFMGFAGTAAAQNADDGLVDIEIGDQTTGDATAATEVNVDQNNNNAQVGTADASNGDTVAVADGSGSGGSALGGAAADDGHTKDSAQQLASPADAGAASAVATANAEVNQAQDVDQQNAAEVSDVNTVAESGDNTGVETDVEADISVDDGAGDGAADSDLEERVSDLEEGQESLEGDIAEINDNLVAINDTIDDLDLDVGGGAPDDTPA